MADLRSETGAVKRGRSVCKSHSIFGTDIFGDFSLESLNGRPLGDKVSPQHLNHRFNILFVQPLLAVRQQRSANRPVGFVFH
ncbi:hypothetical protein D1872_318240 [compost metagenome]